MRIKISWHFLEVTHLLFLFEGGASSKMNSRCHLHYNLNCSSFEVGDNEADIKNRQGKNYHLLLLLIVIDWFHRAFSCNPHSSLVAPQSPIQVKSINLSTKTSSLIELRQLDTSICVDQFKFTTIEYWSYSHSTTTTTTTIIIITIESRPQLRLRHRIIKRPKGKFDKDRNQLISNLNIHVNIHIDGSYTYNSIQISPICFVFAFIYVLRFHFHFVALHFVGFLQVLLLFYYCINILILIFMHSRDMNIRLIMYIE